MRLLLAEDERELSAALQAVLKRNHYEVDAVYDGGEAYDYLQTGNYDGFILDVMMPVMDGYEAVREIRSSGRADAQSIPIIALTANAFLEDAERVKKEGMNEHLPKPPGRWENAFRIGKIQEIGAVTEAFLESFPACQIPGSDIQY